MSELNPGKELSPLNQTTTFEMFSNDMATVPIEAGLLYDPADPYAVNIVFNTEDQPIVWTFAHDLLVRGISEPTGDGDVRIRPCLDRGGETKTVIQLTGPDGEARMNAKTADLQEFIHQANAPSFNDLEPPHSEVDSFIARVLAESEGL